MEVVSLVDMRIVEQFYDLLTFVYIFTLCKLW